LINETQKRRLVGLIVLLAIIFLLSELLPHNLSESGEPGVPSTTLPLATNPQDGAAPPAAQEDAGSSTGGPQVAQNPQAGPALRADASVSPPGAAPARPSSSSSAMPAEVSAMPATAAAPEAPAAQVKPPKPAAPKAEPAKPAETAKADSKPRSATTPPALKLAQSLPAPSVKAPPAAEPPKPAKPTPPPVPPIPRLATSVQAPPPIAAAQGKLWYVQIGSFADQGNAQTTLNLLQNIGFRGESSRITGNSGSALYRVRLGPFPSEAVAQQALAKVSHQGYPQARVLSEAPGKP